MTWRSLLVELILGPPSTSPAGTAEHREAALYHLAYLEAQRRLEAQAKALDEIRTRAGTMIAAATIVTSFLGSRFADGITSPPSGFVYVALGAFVVCVLCAVFCLIPYGGWRFHFGTRKLIQEYVEGSDGLSVPEIERDLALHLEDNFSHNERRLGRLYWLFVASATALGVEIVAWLADLAGVCG